MGIEIVRNLRAIGTKSRVGIKRNPLNISILNHNAALTRSLCQSCAGTVSNLLRPHSINQKVLRHINREFRAVNQLISRSFPPQNGINNLQVRLFHSSNHNYQKATGNDEDKKKKEDEQKDMIAYFSKAIFFTLLGYLLISILAGNSQNPEMLRFVSWNEFVHHMLAKGEVEEVIVRPDSDIVTIHLHEGAIIKGKRLDYKTFFMNVSDVNKFEEKLRNVERKLGIRIESAVPIVYERSDDFPLGKILAILIAGAIVLAVFPQLSSFGSNMMNKPLSTIRQAKFTLVDPLLGVGKGVKFSDVAGLKEAKVEVAEFVDYLKSPDRYKTLGAKVPKGALLLGPPGCGKTLLAKAVATEANVPFLSMNGSEFIEKIGGLGAARVRDLFKEGRKRSPCILFIDEIDAIGRKRGGSGPFDGHSQEGEQTLNQLLVEMDGMASKEGVLMLAATNRAEVLDSALLRPGRFDRHILIDLPNLQERIEIFELHLKGIKLEKPPSAYSKRLAYLSPGFSGADIANVCNEAALHAARSLQKTVQDKDLEYAIERTVGGTEKKSHAMSPVEKRVVAYHESGHALVGWLLPYTDALLKVTIVPRTTMALGFAQYIPTDQKLYTREELFDRMCMALGGRVAESLTFDSITTGAQNDLEKVTKMAAAQVKQFGMSENVGLVSFEEEDRQSRRPYSKKLAALMDAEIQRLVAKAYRSTEDLLRNNSDKLKALAEELLKKETLNYDDVVSIIGPPPFPNKKFIEPVEFEASVEHSDKSSESETVAASPKSSTSSKVLSSKKSKE
nr:PREDICTED: paraplegin [Bemisia tabaci]